MRNLIFAINTTLDGCVDHTKQILDDETLEYFMHFMRDVDLQVFGRKTSQLMVPYWPEVAKNQSKTTLKAVPHTGLMGDFYGCNRQVILQAAESGGRGGSCTA